MSKTGQTNSLSYESLQPHNRSLTSVSYFLIQRIPGIDDQLRFFADAVVVDPSMFGADDHAVRAPDHVIRQLMVTQGLAVTDRVRVVKRDLGNERIVIHDFGTAGTEEIDDR